jgi:regulator of protease activity HflC (stomatin/prohibitin superfamily)
MPVEVDGHEISASGRHRQLSMATGERAGYSDSVEQSMNQVLLAERDARDAVARCRSEAARILAAAEEDVRRIVERTEGRVSLANRIADRTVDLAVREPRGPEAGAATPVPEADVRDLLERAVDGLVDEILGEEP